MIILITIVLGAVGSIVAAELLGACPNLARKLLANALERLPAEVEDRYRMEWDGDFHYMRTTRGALATLLWALGVNLSSWRLSTECKAATEHVLDTSRRERAHKVLNARAGSYSRATRIRPVETFYDSLGDLDERSLTLVEHALDTIVRYPFANHALNINGRMLYVVRTAPSESGLARILLYYVATPRVVRPLLACKVPDIAADGRSEPSRVAVERALLRALQKSVERLFGNR